MSKETNTSEVTKTLKALLATDTGEKILIAAMDKMFNEGKWEIPDDAVTGVVSNKVAQLQSQVTSLTQLVSALSAKVEGAPIQATGRVDAIEAAKKKGGK